MNGMTQVDLRIDLGREPVTGSLATAGLETTPFSGYTGLIAALEALRLDEQARQDTTREEHT
jgi:hypothetical protein